MNSKSFYFIIVISVFMFSNSFSNTNFEIHPRIGNVITNSTKEYFGLFPSIIDFKSAKLYKVNDSEYYFLIEHQDPSVQTDTINFKSNTLVELQRIIEYYEYIFIDDNKIVIAWDSDLLKLISPRMQYYPEQNEIKFISQNDEIINGKLLWADESVIILQDNLNMFNWTDTNFKAFHYSQIKEILLPKSCNFRGNYHIYNENLKYLQDLSEFYEINENYKYTQVPELQNIIFEAKKKFENISNKNDININDLILLNEKDFIIGIDFTIAPLFLNMFYEINLNGITKTYQNTKPNPTWIYTESKITQFNGIGLFTNFPSIVLEYNIFNNVNLSLGFNYYDNEFSYSKSEPNGISNKGYTINLMCGYTKYHNMFSMSFIDNFEFSYRVGVIYGNLDNEIFINTVFDGIRYTNINMPIKKSQSIFGINFETRISYFLTEYLTFDSRIMINHIGQIKLDEWKRDLDPYHQLNIKEDSYSYTGFGLRFGLGYRF